MTGKAVNITAKLLDAVVMAVLQNAPATLDPAHSRSQVASQQESERLPERASCGTFPLVAAEPLPMRSLPGWP
jgi:hypothetical protein